MFLIFHCSVQSVRDTFIKVVIVSYLQVFALKDVCYLILYKLVQEL